MTIQFLKKHLPVFVFVLCVIQPLMDVVSFFLIRGELSTWPMMVLRTAVLLTTTLYGFLLTRRKGIYGLTFLLLGIYVLLHIWACVRVGYAQPISDLGNHLRILLLPLTVLAVLTFLRSDERVFPILQTALVCSFGLIVVIVLLSTITGTDPHTYSSGNGICGWFFCGNSQSAIFSMLTPLVICWGIQRWENRFVPFSLLTLVAFGRLFLLGTRLSYAAIAAIGACFFVGLLLTNAKRYWRHACVVLAVAVALLAAYPVSPMVTEQAKHGNVVQEQQARLDDLYTETLARDSQDAAYQAVYEEFAPELAGRFGVAAIRQAYDDSLDYATISGVRGQKILFGKLLMAESPAMTHLFGLELEQFTFQGANFDAENDFYGIYFLCGWVGLALMLLFFGVFVLTMLWKLLPQFPQRLSLPVLALAVSFCCGLTHAVFTAGVLRRSNVSFYLGIIMATAWYLLVNTRGAGSPKEGKDLQP